jgi:hypothetical protein
LIKALGGEGVKKKSLFVAGNNKRRWVTTNGGIWAAVTPGIPVCMTREPQTHA